MTGFEGTLPFPHAKTDAPTKTAGKKAPATAITAKLPDAKTKRGGALATRILATDLAIAYTQATGEIPDPLIIRWNTAPRRNKINRSRTSAILKK